MLLAHTIINVVIMIIQSTEVLVYSAFMYGIDNEGSYTTVIILVLLNGFAGMFMGLLVSILCDTYRVATMFMAGIFIPLMTFSGKLNPPSIWSQCLSFPFSLQELFGQSRECRTFWGNIAVELEKKSTKVFFFFNSILDISRWWCHLPDQL